MLADRSRLIRLLLIGATVCAAVAWPTRHRGSAYAQGDDDDDGASGDDDDGGSASGDDDSGDDDGSAAGDDDGGGDDDGSAGDDDADKDQPPVTAGGLYTKKTYPISQIERPLTLIKGMTEVRVSLGTDISAQTAFEKWNTAIDGHYGVQDNAEIQFGLATDLNKFSSFDAYIGYEGSLSYDLVDFRAAFVLPILKTVDSSGDSSTSVFPGIQIGFPFRYAPKPQVAIIALQNLMTIDFRSKPDLTPEVGIIGQPIPQFAAILKAGIKIIDFNTDAGNFQIPASIAFQFTPNNALDLALQFAFPNLKPASTMDAMGNDTTPKFYDNRTLLLYGQFRF
jgi:hypothetical protein